MSHHSTRSTAKLQKLQSVLLLGPNLGPNNNTDCLEERIALVTQLINTPTTVCESLTNVFKPTTNPTADTMSETPAILEDIGKHCHHDSVMPFKSTLHLPLISRCQYLERHASTDVLYSIIMISVTYCTKTNR